VEFNIAQVFAAVAAANPDRDCIVFGDQRFTYAQTDERARRFARALHGWGLGAHRERSQLAAHESGQSHLGLYMANCNEFIEAMLGAYKARVAPFNVNYRYVADELVYLLDNAHADAVMYHARFAPTLAQALEKGALPSIPLIHVDDGSGNDPLPGAVRYETCWRRCPTSHWTSRCRRRSLCALHRRNHRDAEGGAVAPARHLRERHGWTGPRHRRDGDEPRGNCRAIACRGPGSMTVAPLMHGAAQWAAFLSLCSGRPFVMPPTTTHLDAAEALRLASRERVMTLSMVGDAFGRPLVNELESGDYDLSGLLILITAGLRSVLRSSSDSSSCCHS